MHGLGNVQNICEVSQSGDVCKKWLAAVLNIIVQCLENVLSLM
jgi:hypothetical protein